MTVEVSRLPSGLTVITDSMPHLQTATMGVWVGSGSRDEQPHEHGISHLLEHMAFKGTERRTALRETARLVDPHTAVGLAVAEKETRDPSRDSAIPMIVLGTAHPAKFPDAVEAACGMRPELPDWLSDLASRKERVATMSADQAAIEKFILAASRAAREGAAA